MLQTEVRDQRIDIGDEEEEPEMFAMERDADYDGLQAGDGGL